MKWMLGSVKNKTKTKFHKTKGPEVIYSGAFLKKRKKDKNEVTVPEFFFGKLL